MVGCIQAGDTRIVAINGQQVLCQVIGAYRNEIHNARETAHLIYRCRHLNHDPDHWPLNGIPFLLQLNQCPVNLTHGLLDLMHTGDHGQHDAQIVEPFGCTQHGAHLDQKDLRVIQGYPDAAPAKEGVVFLNGEVGQRLVTPDIQRSHSDRAWCKGFQLSTVALQLLLLTGEKVADHERYFGSVQTDPFRPTLQRAGHIRYQPGIHPQGHAVAV